SCGAATLATILKYQYGKPVTERQVAIGLMKRARYVKHPKLVQLRQGFSLLDLKRYADSKGYKGIGLGKLTLGGLVKRVPVIVPVRLHGYNHFVVFRGISGDRVLLADPAWGNRTMLVDRFKDAWIDYPKFGHVGFVVAKASGKLAPPNGLAPRPREFRFRR
ncbi:MAG TPA: cysteine peptidase family C39 domain-containing protein, partial [Gammaproteobacteria bacterium]|nr:cysteine peptidase family C39 domain-containing protein [Gammaproteobacteria bacterium]